MAPGLLSFKVPTAPELSDRQAPGSLSPVVSNGQWSTFQVQDNRALGFLLLATLEFACVLFIGSIARIACSKLSGVLELLFLLEGSFVSNSGG